MRFYEAEIGAQRVRTRFLWGRLKIGKETRWLERASWVEERREGFRFGGAYWSPIEWRNEP